MHRTTYGVKWVAAIIGTGYVEAHCPGWGGGLQGVLRLLTKTMQEDLTAADLDAAHTLTRYANSYAVKHGHKQAAYPATFVQAAYRQRGTVVLASDIRKMQQTVYCKDQVDAP